MWTNIINDPSLFTRLLQQYPVQIAPLYIIRETILIQKDFKKARSILYDHLNSSVIQLQLDEINTNVHLINLQDEPYVLGNVCDMLASFRHIFGQKRYKMNETVLFACLNSITTDIHSSVRDCSIGVTYGTIDCFSLILLASRQLLINIP